MSFPTNLHSGKDYTNIADRPSAALFGVGKAVISNSSYYIDSNSNGVEWYSHGSGAIATRPSATLFGKGEWIDGIDTYRCNGTDWIASIKTIEVDAISDLATIPAAITSVYVKESGRGGVFHLESTGTVDNGTVFSGLTGFWVRQNISKIDVRWWGYVGDGVVDDAVALNAAYAYQHTTQVTNTGTGSAVGASIPVFIPKSISLINSTVIIPNAYSQTISDGAIIVKGASFVGTVGFDMTAAWRAKIDSVQFRDFDTPLKIYNNNINSGLIEIENCGFFGSTGAGISIEAQSTHVVIRNCMFRSNVHEATIVNCDLVTWDGGWISRGVLTADYDAGIINHGILNMHNVLCVPTTQTAVEPAWINNYRSVKITDTRFGGESGSHVVVNNFAKWANEPSPLPFYVTITGGDVFNSAAEKTSIRFFEIPNLTSITRCSGFVDSGYISWSNTLDSTAQAAKIAEITASINTIQRNYVLIDVSNNSSSYSVNANGLVPSNLMPFVASVGINAYRIGETKYKEARVDFVGASSKAAVINFECTDTTIATGTELGRLQGYSNDGSGGGAGIVSWIKQYLFNGTANSGAIAIGTGQTGGTSAQLTQDRVIIDSLGNVYPAETNLRSLGLATQIWSAIYSRLVYIGASATAFITSGSNSPETVVTAPVGSLFIRDNGAVGLTLYVKTSGTGNTGWSLVPNASAGGTLLQPRTTTPAGTTGAQTINKATGAVNFAASATSLVVTNSEVVATSIIHCTVATNDATMKSAVAVAASGSFTIYPNIAPTAETRVNFSVTN